MIPDSFRKDVLGETEDETSKVLIENASAEAKPFALLYQFEGDQKASLRVLYNCSAARPNEDGSHDQRDKAPPARKRCPSPLPRWRDGKVKAKTTDTTTETVIQNWFKSVWQPNVGV